MPEIIDKIVDFSKCVNCKHKSTNDSDEPCHTCLNTPSRPYSHTPINFESKFVSLNPQNSSNGNNQN